VSEHEASAALEDDLDAIQQAFQGALDSAMDSVAILDADDRYVWLNQAHADVYGYDSPEDLIGETWRTLYEDEEIERLETEIFPSLEEQGVWRGEAEGRRADGETFPQRITLQRLADGRLICIVRDLSNRKEIARKRRRALRPLEAVVREAPLIVFELDEEGVFTLSRGRALEQVGLEPGEVVGESIFDVYAGYEPILEDARRALDGEAIESVNEVGGRIFETEWRPIDHAGEIDRVIGVATDVTQRQRSQRELEFTVQAAPLALFTMAPDGAITSARGQLFERLGFSSEDVVGAKPTEIFPEREMDEGALGRVLSGLPARTTSDLGEVHIETHFSPEFDEDGNLERVIGVSMDVTERHETREKLEASRAKYQTLFEASGDGILLTDEDGVVLEVNDRKAEMHGVEPDQARGEPVWELYPPHREDDIRSRFRRLWEEAPTTEELHVEDRPGEELHLEIRAARIELDGEPVIQTISRDISQRIEAERRRRQAEEQFETAVGGLSRRLGNAGDREELAASLAQGALQTCHPEATVVVENETLLAHATSGTVAQDELETWLDRSPETFAWFDASLPEADNPVQLGLVTHGPLSEHDRRKVEILAQQAAITLQRNELLEKTREAHDRIEEIAREKQVFLDLLGHDLRNPIANAKGRLELLTRKQPEVADNLQTAIESLERADELIDDSLTYSRLVEEERPERTERDVTELVEDVIARFRGSPEKGNVRVNVEGPARLPFPVNDLFDQAVENLVSNALKFNPDDEPMEIALEDAGESMRLRVVDHGPGIDVGEGASLFERFERDGQTVGGIGLGLPIVKRIVDMHDGDVRHKPTPGGGATFEIELPREDER
jgi:PAS domain S-box-containing protein